MVLSSPYPFPLLHGSDISLVPSSLYSYSFAQSPEWSETFAPQDEILVRLRSFTPLIYRLQHSLFHNC